MQINKCQFNLRWVCVYICLRFLYSSVPNHYSIFRMSLNGVILYKMKSYFV